VRASGLAAANENAELREFRHVRSDRPDDIKHLRVLGIVQRVGKVDGGPSIHRFIE